jgi:hypothetical protein
VSNVLIITTQDGPNPVTARLFLAIFAHSVLMKGLHEMIRIRGVLDNLGLDGF